MEALLGSSTKLGDWVSVFFKPSNLGFGFRIGLGVRTMFGNFAQSMFYRSTHEFGLCFTSCLPAEPKMAAFHKKKVWCIIFVEINGKNSTKMVKTRVNKTTKHYSLQI